MEPEQLIARVQELTGRLEDLEDRACRELAEELTGAVVQMYGAGLERIVELIEDEETRDRLERLGYDVSNYKPLPPIHPSEQRSQAHPPEDIEQFVVDAKLSALDRAWAERGEVIYHEPGTVLRRRFEAEITIR